MDYMILIDDYTNTPRRFRRAAANAVMSGRSFLCLARRQLRTAQERLDWARRWLADEAEIRRQEGAVLTALDWVWQEQNRRTQDRGRVRSF